MAKRMLLTRMGKKPVIKTEIFEIKEVPSKSVHIAVSYAGVNFADVLMALGLYPDAPKPPAVPGYEIAGKVLQAGKGSIFKKGDSVAAFTKFGGYSDEVILSDDQVIKLPAAMDLKTAAAVPVNYTTAALALKSMARVRKDDWVLIHAGSGGVGTLAIQIAKTEGAKVITTVGSQVKIKTAKNNGADYVINYREQRFEEEVLKITNNRGVDIILDPIGGKILKKDFACLSDTGRVILFGLSDMLKNGKGSKLGLASSFFKSLAFSPMLLMNRNAGIFGLNMLEFFGSPREQVIKDYLSEGINAVAKGKIKINIGAEYNLEDVYQAHLDLLSRKTIGKSVLKCR
ncbi:MAG: zinc-binding dehydrogenase [Acidobacteria bacterium]|nr:zinc-binding dehydrogenase [Acidobacteriota bacterium]